jgi:hypothetical protein
MPHTVPRGPCARALRAVPHRDRAPVREHRARVPRRGFPLMPAMLPSPQLASRGFFAVETTGAAYLRPTACDLHHVPELSARYRRGTQGFAARNHACFIVEDRLSCDLDHFRDACHAVFSTH